jgi:hypothetical protein
VTFELFAVPLLAALQGTQPAERVRQREHIDVQLIPGRRP